MSKYNTMISIMIWKHNIPSYKSFSSEKKFVTSENLENNPATFQENSAEQKHPNRCYVELKWIWISRRFEFHEIFPLNFLWYQQL